MTLTAKMLLEEKRNDILRIARRHGVRTVRVFGSVVRGEFRMGSDVDFLVETGRQTSSWFPAGLVLELQELLGCPVDIVTEKGLSPLLRETVLKEAIRL